MDSGNHNYQFVAGNLALDFVNTMAYRAHPVKKEDRLRRAEDVLRWATQAELPDVAVMKSGSRFGAAALEHIRATREQLFTIFHAIADNDAISADMLARVGNTFNDCCAKRRLSSDEEAVRWVWRANARPVDYLLYPVLASAIELLTADAHSLVRQCEDTECGWLFLDRSNARKRRWCSMADCGNRNKARNYHRRDVSTL